MKRLVFHIGTPKTGSSAIQIFLAKNHDALLAKSVDYLKVGEFALGTAGKISSGNGSHLSRCVLPEGAPAWIENAQPHVEAFFEAVQNSKSDVGIVSSELFVYADEQQLTKLINRLQQIGITAECFYYIRSQVQFLSSAYIQQVKRHGCTEDPVRNVSRSYKPIPFLKYYSFLQKMRGLFGEGNVHCRTYEGTFGVKQGLYFSFLEALKIPNEQLDYAVSDVNTSMSPREVAIMLVLNRFKPRMKFSDLVVANAIQRGSGASGQVHNFLPHEFVSEIEAYFDKENRTLASAYFKRSELFPPFLRQGEPDEISLDGLSATDLLEFMGGLIVRFDERLANIEARQANQKAKG